MTKVGGRSWKSDIRKFTTKTLFHIPFSQLITYYLTYSVSAKPIADLTLARVALAVASALLAPSRNTDSR